jgi:hypothetical protein
MTRQRPFKEFEQLAEAAGEKPSSFEALCCLLSKFGTQSTTAAFTPDNAHKRSEQ